jgi:O-antigen/teichoic acid export membrane protein
MFFLLFFLYTARKIGPEPFGIFSFALGVGYLIYSFMDFGLDALVVKWVARNGRDYFNALFQFRALVQLSRFFNPLK